MAEPENESALRLLLEVQQHDTTLDQLGFRLRELEERRLLEQLRSRLKELDGFVMALSARKEELSRRQEEIERHVQTHSARIETIEARMRQGTGFREMEAMGEEAASLSRRRRSFEDDELEVMERLEELEGELRPLAEEHDRLVSEEESRASRLAAAEEALTKEIAAVSGEREALAFRLPRDLAATYERLRTRLGGIGAATLIDGTCSGCHLKLPSSERERAVHAAPGEVVFCDQCGRILVA